MGRTETLDGVLRTKAEHETSLMIETAYQDVWARLAKLNTDMGGYQQAQPARILALALLFSKNPKLRDEMVIAVASSTNVQERAVNSFWIQGRPDWLNAMLRTGVDYRQTLLVAKHFEDLRKAENKLKSQEEQLQELREEIEELTR